MYCARKVYKKYLWYAGKRNDLIGSLTIYSIDICHSEASHHESKKMKSFVIGGERAIKTLSEKTLHPKRSSQH